MRMMKNYEAKIYLLTRNKKKKKEHRTEQHQNCIIKYTSSPQ
jgi:hypothetical protein